MDPSNNDATQPLDHAVLSAFGRSVVPKKGSVLAPATPAAPPPGKAPQRGAVLAPASQAVQRTRALLPPHLAASSDESRVAAAAADNEGPAQEVIAATLALSHNSEVDEETELFALPRSTSRPKQPAKLRQTEAEAERTKDVAERTGPSAAVPPRETLASGTIMPSESNRSSTAAPVSGGSVPKSARETARTDDVEILNATPVADQRAPKPAQNKQPQPSSGPVSQELIPPPQPQPRMVAAPIATPAPSPAAADGFQATLQVGTLRLDDGDDDAAAAAADETQDEASPVVKADSMPPPPLQPQPQRRLVVDATPDANNKAIEEKIVPKLPSTADESAGRNSTKSSAKPYLADDDDDDDDDDVKVLPPRHSAGSRRASGGTAEAPTRVGDASTPIAAAATGATAAASKRAGRPPPIVIADPRPSQGGRDDDDEFKTPDRVVRRMSQDEAPLVRPSVTPAQQAATTASPSRRRAATTAPLDLKVGDAVEARWGGRWHPGWVLRVAEDGLTVDVEWVEGSWVAVRRNEVRASRKSTHAGNRFDSAHGKKGGKPGKKGDAGTPTPTTISTTKRLRSPTTADHTPPETDERSTRNQPKAASDGGGAASASKIVTSTQLVDAMAADDEADEQATKTDGKQPSTATGAAASTETPKLLQREPTNSRVALGAMAPSPRGSAKPSVRSHASAAGQKPPSPLLAPSKVPTAGKPAERSSASVSGGLSSSKVSSRPLDVALSSIGLVIVGRADERHAKKVALAQSRGAVLLDTVHQLDQWARLVPPGGISSAIVRTRNASAAGASAQLPPTLSRPVVVVIAAASASQMTQSDDLLDALQRGMANDLAALAAIATGYPVVSSDWLYEANPDGALGDHVVPIPGRAQLDAPPPAPLRVRPLFGRKVALAVDVTEDPPCAMVLALVVAGAIPISASVREAAEAHVLLLHPGFKGTLPAPAAQLPIVEAPTLVKACLGQEVELLALKTPPAVAAAAPSSTNALPRTPLLAGPPRVGSVSVFRLGTPISRAAGAGAMETPTRTTSRLTTGEGRAVLFTAGEDYYVKLPAAGSKDGNHLPGGDDGAVVLARIEEDHFEGAPDVKVRCYAHTGMQLIGHGGDAAGLGITRKPFGRIELVGAPRRIAPSCVIPDLPVFILPPAYLDHVYILDGPEQPPGSEVTSGGGGSTTATSGLVVDASPAMHTRLNAETASRRDGRPDLELFDPLPSESSFGNGNDGVQRRAFQRGRMRGGAVIERGVVIVFETGPDAGTRHGEVHGLFQRGDDQYIQVEVVERDAAGEMVPTGEFVAVDPRDVVSS